MNMVLPSGLLIKCVDLAECLNILPVQIYGKKRIYQNQISFQMNGEDGHLNAINFIGDIWRESVRDFTFAA